MVSSAVASVRGVVPRTRSLARRLEAVPVRRVLATLVALQWALVVGLALVVKHSGWIYYQGGDQLWYWTTGWLVDHGHFPPPGVGYLWSVLLAPIALVTGPNLLQAFPAVIAFQFLFLLPVAPLALYGIGARLGGRLFGYWTAALWLLVPLIGIRYTDTGYHQRFTEVLLPQGFGLTAMADFPTMLACLIAAYFCVRALTERDGDDLDAIAAGLAAGAAFAIKPSTALFLVGPVLAFLVARRWRAGVLFGVALLPAAFALAFVKYRGLGYVPVLHSADAMRTAAGLHAPLVTAGIGTYIPFHRDVFIHQLDLVREHFWSVRLVEWLVIGGAIAVFLRSRKLGALIVGWFAAVVILKTGSGRGDMEGGNLLRLLMPAYPAFVLMLASLPFLVPGLARRPAAPHRPPRLLSQRARLVGVVAAFVLTAVVPIAAWAAASPLQEGTGIQAAFPAGPPIPVGRDLGVETHRTPGGVLLTWRRQHPAGGPVFYNVLRRPVNAPYCYQQTAPSGAAHCVLSFTNLGSTRATRFLDRTKDTVRYVYYVGVSANWRNDTAGGDIYVLSRGAAAP